jgi:hypothetical protein
LPLFLIPVLGANVIGLSVVRCQWSVDKKQRTTDDGQRTGALAYNFRENIALAEDLVFFAVDFDFGAAVFAEDYFVADFHGELATVAGIEELARTGGDYFAALRLLLGCIWQHNAAGGHLFGFEWLDYDSIIKGTQFDFGHF